MHEKCSRAFVETLRNPKPRKDGLLVIGSRENGYLWILQPKIQ